MSPSLNETPRDVRRDGPRQLTVLMVAKVRAQDGEYACVVRDVSQHGLRARFPHSPAVGQRLAFSLRGQPEVVATVRWTDGLSAGVEFDEPLDVVAVMQVDPAARAPRAPRFRCGQPAVLKLAADARDIELIDVSLGGAKLGVDDRSPALAPGTWATLALPGSSELRAGTVCWMRERTLGFRFAFALPLDVLATVLARGGR